MGYRMGRRVWRQREGYPSRRRSGSLMDVIRGKPAAAATATFTVAATATATAMATAAGSADLPRPCATVLLLTVD